MELLALAMLGGVLASIFVFEGDDETEASPLEKDSDFVEADPTDGNQLEGRGDLLDEGSDAQLGEPTEKTKSDVLDEVSIGDSGANIIYGSESNDVVSAGDGDDTVYGGSGCDLIDGRANLYQDYHGGTFTWGQLMDDGSDHLFGGEGNDTIGLSQGDVAFGGAGGDVYSVYHSDGANAADIPVIRDFDPNSDKLRLIFNFGPGDSDHLVGRELSDGEFELDGSLTFVPNVLGAGIVVCVEGEPVVIVEGMSNLEDCIVELRAFLSE